MGISRLNVSFPRAVLAPTAWDGADITKGLTVTVEEIMPGGRRFAPLGVEFVIRVFGSAIGDTPNKMLGTVFGQDGVRPEYASKYDPTSTLLQGSPPSDAWLASDGFHAIDPTFQGVHYVVHTGDSGNYRNERVGHASHRNKAFQYGQNPGHTYSTPGTYTGRSIYVYDNDGKWGRLDLGDLVVEDPDFSFGPVANGRGACIVVSNDVGEDWSTAPPHDAANRCTTMEQALLRYAAIKGTVPIGEGVRISVKPGTTYNEYAKGRADNGNFLDNRGMRGRLLFDTWDQGVTQCFYDERGMADGRRGQLFMANNNSWPIAIKGWRFHLGYDVFNGLPNTGEWTTAGTESLMNIDRMNEFATFAGAPGLDPVRGYRMILDNCDVEGCTSAVFPCQGAGETQRWQAFFWNNCVFKNNLDYVTFQPSNWFITGTQVLEEYGVELGCMGRGRVGGGQRGWRGHRNIRETTGWVGYIRASFMEARGGWSGQNDGDTFYSPQALMRLYESSNKSLRFGKRFYFCDSVFLHDFNVDTSGNTYNDKGSGFAVIENCVLIVDPSAGGDAGWGGLGGGKGFRNNMVICLNTGKYRDNVDFEPDRNLSRWEQNNGNMQLGSPLQRMFEVQYGPRNFGMEMEALHNTFVQLRPDAGIAADFAYITPTTNPFGATALAQPIETYYEVIEGHNVRYAPNLAVPEGPAMSTIDMPAGVRVLDIWLKFVWERTTITLPAPVAPGQTTPPFPYPLDWYNQPTTGADYAGSGGLNSLKIANQGAALNGQYAQSSVAVAFAASDMDSITVNHDRTAAGAAASPPGTGTHFTITNRSTVTWPAGVVYPVILDRGSTAMEPDLVEIVDQNEVKLYRPTTPQALTPGVRSTLFDFARNLRPNAGFAISPTVGTNAAGALLPA